MTYTEENPAAVSPASLPEGGWGAKGAPGLLRGHVVEITTRAGKSWLAQVDSVVVRTRFYCIVTTTKLGTHKHPDDHPPLRGPRSGRHRRDVFDPS